jgi:putative protease
MALISADRHPLTTATLREQLGRMGDTPFQLSNLDNQVAGEVILPIKELNRLRRRLVEALQEKLQALPSAHRMTHAPALMDLLPRIEPGLPARDVEIIPLCRSLEQVQMVLEEGVQTLYVDLEDIRRYAEAVALARNFSGVRIYLATPRIQKATELGFFKLIEAAKPDGVLVRNLGAIDYFRGTGLSCVGDFSLNVANPLTAQILIKEGLERVAVSYDLNIDQVQALLRGAPANWFEIVLHQHMPMFHMEHCVFAAFLSNGTDFLTCGRPCDRHDVRLRDRVGIDHPVMADVGCRNTVYHGKAQTGAAYLNQFREAGVSAYRLEFLREKPEDARRILRAYDQLLRKEMAAPDLVKELQVVNQLGVTSGTLTVLS